MWAGSLGGTGVVPAGRARALQRHLHDVLGVVGELHRLPDAYVGEGLLRGQHRQHVPLGVLDAGDRGAVGGGDDTGGREVEVGLREEVDLPGQQGVRAGRHVGDGVEVDGVQDRAAGPVVLVRGDPSRARGRERLQFEGAGADARAADAAGAAVGDDIAVVVGEEARELRVGGLERHDERAGVGRAQLPGVDERGEDGRLRGRGLLGEDVAQGVRGVGGGECPSVVEGDARAEAEGPGAGLGVRFPGLGEVGDQVAVRADADEAVVEGAQVLVRGQGARRVEGLGVGGGRPGDAEGAAAVGGAPLRVRGQRGGGRGARAAGEQPGRTERRGARRGRGEDGAPSWVVDVGHGPTVLLAIRSAERLSEVRER